MCGESFVGKARRHSYPSRDEFFAELRLKSISHVGQVEQAIIEANGQVSIYFYGDDHLRWGLQYCGTFLKHSKKRLKSMNIIPVDFVVIQKSWNHKNTIHTCKVCKKDLWVKASARKRVE